MGQKVHRGEKQKEKQTDITEKKKKENVNQSISREALSCTNRTGSATQAEGVHRNQ